MAQFVCVIVIDYAQSHGFSENGDLATDIAVADNTKSLAPHFATSSGRFSHPPRAKVSGGVEYLQEVLAPVRTVFVPVRNSGKSNAVGVVAVRIGDPVGLYLNGIGAARPYAVFFRHGDAWEYQCRDH